MGNRKVDLELVREFVEASRADLDSAENELKNRNFHNSVYHSQQSAEKICKALLIIHGKFASVHMISPLLEEVTRKEKLRDEILIILKDLEKHWLISRYPFRRGKEIWSPVRGYTNFDAEQALKKAKTVFKTLSKLLKKRYGV
jgi:HEPN domain-containing protein